MDGIAVKVDKVSKDFLLPHQKTSSLKSGFTGMLRKRSRKIEVQKALQDIGFEIKQGEFFGIVGRNGSGKSTLLKIIAGIYQPTEGEVAVRGRLVPFIELGVGFNPELTGRENVYLNGALLGFSKKEIDKMYSSIVAFAEIERFMDQKLKNYSSGMQVRLAFSVAIKADADILLIDEVLAVGDADFQRKCFSYFRSLKRNKKTVVFVSHDMDAVREYCDRAVMIEDGKLFAEGNTAKVATEYLKLFDDVKPDDSDLSSSRTGNGFAKFDKITCQPLALNEQKTLKITCQMSVKKDIENSIIGFYIQNEAGVRLLGSNNKLENERIDLVKGQKRTVTWEVPNVFSQGKYSVGVAIQAQDQTICDWWDGAVIFETIKKAQTGYIVNPDVKLVVS